MLKKIKNIVSPLFKKINTKKEWKQIEYFEDSWKNRLRVMVKYIPNDITIMDLGCGPMWLKEFVKYKKYYPVDYKKRGDETIVCDFNKKEFPAHHADYAFVGGCLEYVMDHKWFINQISLHVENCVISYCCIDHLTNVDTRRENAWVNDLSKAEIIEEFKNNGMILIKEDMYLDFNTIFVFTKVK
jgi:hypothetical protein